MRPGSRRASLSSATSTSGSAVSTRREGWTTAPPQHGHTDEALFRLNRAYLNSLTEEFVRIVMVAHRQTFDQGVAHARQNGQQFGVAVAGLDDSFQIEYRPDGLCWQFLVTPEHYYLFELSHMDRWMLYRLEGPRGGRSPTTAVRCPTCRCRT